MEKIIPLPYTLTDGDVHPELPRSNVYHQCSNPFGHGAASYEECMFLYALCLVNKPKLIIETGAETGATLLHMALALSHNGFGHLISFELSEDYCKQTNDLLSSWQLNSFAQVRHIAALEGILTIQDKVDLALIDTAISQRYDEFLVLKPKMSPGGIICIHDTSPLHPMRGDVDLRELFKDEKIINIESPRGLTIVQV